MPDLSRRRITCKRRSGKPVDGCIDLVPVQPDIRQEMITKTTDRPDRHSPTTGCRRIFYCPAETGFQNGDDTRNRSAGIGKRWKSIHGIFPRFETLTIIRPNSSKNFASCYARITTPHMKKT